MKIKKLSIYYQLSILKTFLLPCLLLLSSECNKKAVTEKSVKIKVSYNKADVKRTAENQRFSLCSET